MTLSSSGTAKPRRPDAFFRADAKQKDPKPKFQVFLVEISGIEPLTS